MQPCPPPITQQCKTLPYTYLLNKTTTKHRGQYHTFQFSSRIIQKHPKLCKRLSETNSIGQSLSNQILSILITISRIHKYPIKLTETPNFPLTKVTKASPNFSNVPQIPSSQPPLTLANQQARGSQAGGTQSGIRLARHIKGFYSGWSQKEGRRSRHSRLHTTNMPRNATPHTHCSQYMDLGHRCIYN